MIEQACLNGSRPDDYHLRMATLEPEFSMFDFITHYHPAEDPPLRNLSDSREDVLPAILDALAARRSFRSKRVFGRRYMPFDARQKRK